MRLLISLVVVSLSCAGLPVLAQGPGDLAITPTRIVFAGRDRTAQVTLINRSAEPVTYRIGFLQLQMTADGQLAEITEPGPGELFADGLLRFSPRQVTLDPGVAQTVRLLLRKPADLPAGEYRSHLTFQAVPSAPEADVESLGGRQEGIGFHLTPIYRIAIPVIVREGDLDAGTALSDLAFEPADAGGAHRLSFRLHRNGGRSLHGNVTVTFVPSAGRELALAEIDGLALYVPAASRSVVMALKVPDGLDLRGGTLRVRFAEGAAAARPAHAEAELELR